MLNSYGTLKIFLNGNPGKKYVSLETATTAVSAVIKTILEMSAKEAKWSTQVTFNSQGHRLNERI